MAQNGDGAVVPGHEVPGGEAVLRDYAWHEGATTKRLNRIRLVVSDADVRGATCVAHALFALAETTQIVSALDDARSARHDSTFSRKRTGLVSDQ